VGREERAFYLSLILSLLAVFVTYLLNRYAMHAPSPLDVVIYMLAFLTVSSMSLHVLLFRLSGRVLKISELLNAMISSWIELWHKVIKIPAAKPLTGADLRDLLAIPASVSIRSLRLLLWAHQGAVPTRGGRGSC